MLALSLSLFAATASAQFVGPEVTGRTGTVEQIADSRLGSYITVTGNIVAHQREDYFSFRDATGEIRVEIEPSLWAGRKVDASTTVRLLGEVGRGPQGRYLWVKSLDVVN
jgi:uncharacterized protein (TIGR00156 family)